jgi:hypothetical protein
MEGWGKGSRNGVGWRVDGGWIEESRIAGWARGVEGEVQKTNSKCEVLG